MKKMPTLLCTLSVFLGLGLASAAVAAGPVAENPGQGAGETIPARSWVDPTTGHRIVRLSNTPGSLSLYFNFNAYTPQKDKMVFSTPDGINAVDLKTFQVSSVVQGHYRLLFTGHKNRWVYYTDETQSSSAPKVIYAADIDSGKSHVVARIKEGTIQSINSDETLLAGVVEHAPEGSIGRDGLIRKGKMESAGKNQPTYALSKESRMNARLDAKIPMEIFTINTKTGERKVVTASADWLNHLQFSPVDPNLLMYCHEGPWHKVDRIWLIRLDQKHAKPVKVHPRTMNMEIAGHEWFSPDGKTVWYDLQTPRGEDFWVAGYEIATGHRIWYHLLRNEWSVHYNISPDQSLFSGDGGDSEMVAHAPDGKWLYLFHPVLMPLSIAGAKAPDAAKLIRPGAFKAEKLVNMAHHDYRLEPNGRFSPDGKWLFFRSNLQTGKSYVYAVSLEKAAQN